MALLIDHQPIVFNGSANFEVANAWAASQVSIRLGRCTTATPLLWPNVNTRVTVRIYGSQDNGTTWAELSAFSDTGGIKDNYNEEVTGSQAESGTTVNVPPNTNRFRVSASTSNTLRSELTVEVT